MREDAARVTHHASDVLGWARITVHDQGDVRTDRPPVFEGAFSVRGVIHHVATRDSYLLNRGRFDPDFHQDSTAVPAGGLVIWRDSDVMEPWEERAARMGPGREQRRSRTSQESQSEPEPEPEPARCAHDNLPWNTDPQLNPVLRPSPNVGPWYDPFGFGRSSLAELLIKRDDIAGSGSSNK